MFQKMRMEADLLKPKITPPSPATLSWSKQVMGKPRFKQREHGLHLFLHEWVMRSHDKRTCGMRPCSDHLWKRNLPRSYSSYHVLGSFLSTFNVTMSTLILNTLWDRLLPLSSSYEWGNIGRERIINKIRLTEVESCRNRHWIQANLYSRQVPLTSTAFVLFYPGCHNKIT